MTYRVGITRDILDSLGEPAFGRKALEILERAPGIEWEYLPRAFEEHAVLRIDEIGLAGRVAEERRREQIGVRQHRARVDVVRVAEHPRIHAARRQLVGRERAHRLDAAAQVLPELADVAGAGKADRHADDGNVLAIGQRALRGWNAHDVAIGPAARRRRCCWSASRTWRARAASGAVAATAPSAAARRPGSS